jgi:hypothetical protein
MPGETPEVSNDPWAVLDSYETPRIPQKTKHLKDPKEIADNRVRWSVMCKEMTGILLHLLGKGELEPSLRASSFASTEDALAVLYENLKEAIQKGLYRHREAHKLLTVLSDPRQMMEHLCKDRASENLHAILTSDSTTMQDDVPGVQAGPRYNMAVSEKMKPRITAELETAHSSVTVSAVASGWMSNNMEGIKKALAAQHETVETTEARCITGWSANEHAGNTTKNKNTGFRGRDCEKPAWKDGSREKALLTGSFLGELKRLPVIFAAWCGDLWHYTNKGPGSAAPTVLAAKPPGTASPEAI